MTERLNVEGQGVPFPSPDDQPTEEIPVVTQEMVDAEQPQPSRLRRVGNWLLESMAASSGYGYGAARAGMRPPPPRPPKQPEIKTDDDCEGDDCPPKIGD